VQRSAGKTGNLANGLLKFRRRGHERVINRNLVT
jgi:hypothetical protein